MINVAADIAPDASDLAGLACGHLDDLVTYVTHLSGSAEDAVEFVAGGLAHAAKYPPTRLRVDGRAALYRAATRAAGRGTASRRAGTGRHVSYAAPAPRSRRGSTVTRRRG